jgi:hypothetical protein
MSLVKAEETDVSKFVKDLAERSFHTLWQAVAASFVVLYAASGLNVSNLVTLSGLEKAWSSVAIGVGAALLSALKTSVMAFIATPEGKADIASIESAVPMSDAELHNLVTDAALKAQEIFATLHKSAYDPVSTAPSITPAGDQQVPEAAAVTTVAAPVDAQVAPYADTDAMLAADPAVTAPDPTMTDVAPMLDPVDYSTPAVAQSTTAQV